MQEVSIRRPEATLTNFKLRKRNFTGQLLFFKSLLISWSKSQINTFIRLLTSVF
jgi:hypothetical protein